jgi:predicted DNA-binding transcriptional regulator YafY
MASDAPVDITFKILELPRVDDISKSDKYSYTFLFDTFGSRYEYKKTKSGDEFVTVNCSPSEMINWALQHSDRVEIVEPEMLRHDIKERARQISKMYLGE